ncbi:MAG: hypothetical protein JSS59_11630 [Proteobacteria bacterium]|uniref:hypothetical protein n=1 Tax=Rudaea sp. TaxID=2136325 RepID=UPI003784ABD8|nr:hypothetical protein [Pseudomonadota bacterium]
MSIELSISVREDALFSEWKVHRPAFVADGVVNETDYIGSSPRLLFVLKEVNDPDGGDWDLREFLRTGGRPATWDNLARWIEAIRSPTILPWEQIETIDIQRRTAALRSIAAVNLKKTPGWYTSDPNEVSRFADEDSKFLRLQIDLYKPHLVICCGTGDWYKHIMDASNLREWRRTNRGVWYYVDATDVPVLAFAHPEARVPAQYLHYALLDAVRELRGSLPQTTLR